MSIVYQKEFFSDHANSNHFKACDDSYRRAAFFSDRVNKSKCHIMTFLLGKTSKLLASYRFLRSTHFKRNLSAQKIVTTEFATAASRTEQGVNAGKAKKRLFFHQLQILMRGNLSEVMSDNTFITVYPLGSEYFCFYESPFVHRLDPFTLATTARIDLNRRLGLLANSAHPHFDEWGNMFSVGLKVGLTGPEYTVNK